jgi:hypothetical protein
MIPAVDNSAIEAWLARLSQSEKLSSLELQELRELACEASSQWRRKRRVQRMMEAIHSQRLRVISINEILDNYDVRFTSETMRLIENGIQQSLRNFCRLLCDVLSSWDSDMVGAQDVQAQRARLDLAVEQAPYCLWASIDTVNLNMQTVYSRALQAVNGLWKTHALPAIEAERTRLADGLHKLKVLSYACTEFAKSEANPRLVPNKFFSMYTRMCLRIIAALSWLSCCGSWISAQSELVLVRSALAAYRHSAREARSWMSRNAKELETLINDMSQSLERTYRMDDDWIGWHRMVLWGDDEDAPEEAFSSLIVQPPGYSSSFWNTKRVYCSVLPRSPACGSDCHHNRTQLVVRFCAMLKTLVHRGFLRLDVIGVDYLRLLTTAEHSRYHFNVEKIVNEVFAIRGYEAGEPFDISWFDEAWPRTQYQPDAGPALSDLALVLEDEPDKLPASSASDTGQTDDSSVAPLAPLPKPVPEGVYLDHSVMSLFSLVAFTATLGEQTTPYCNAFHVGTNDVVSHVRRALSLSMANMCTKSLDQRLAHILKLYAAAINAAHGADGITARFDKCKAHPRNKKLIISWPIEADHRARNMTRLAQLAAKVVAYLHHETPMPAGVEWVIPERSKRRNRASDVRRVAEVAVAQVAS